jgi:multiubiquitin
MSELAHYTFILNGRQFQVAEPVIEGLQIRVLGDLDHQFELIVEGAGDKPDAMIKDTDSIDLRQGPVCIYAKPPTAFG